MTEPVGIPVSERVELARFLKRGGAFVFGALLLFLGINGLFSAKLDDAAKRRFAELYQPQVSAGYVILGSSHSANGITPKFLESDTRQVFNFSFAGADSLYYDRWLHLFREFYPQPRTVLFQLDWFSFRETPFLFREFEYDADLLRPAKFLSLALEPKIDSKKLWLNRFVLFQHRQNVDRLLVPGFQFGEKLISKYYKGFVPADEAVTPGGGIVAPLAPMRRRVLEEIVGRLRDTGIAVIFVQTPEYLQGRQPEPGCQDEVQEFADRLGVPFLNYNTALKSELNEDPTLFADWAHLNERGAEAFSRRLAEDLETVDGWRSP